MKDPEVSAFVETAALWAVLNGDEADARQLVDGMFPHERDVFAEQLGRLLRMLGSYCVRCGARVADPSELVTVLVAFGSTRDRVCRRCAEPFRTRGYRVVRRWEGDPPPRMPNCVVCGGTWRCPDHQTI